MMKKQWIRLLSLALCLSILISTGSVVYAAQVDTAVAEAETESTAPETTAETIPDSMPPETTATTEAEEAAQEAQTPETTAGTEEEGTTPETTAETEPAESEREATAEESIPEVAAEMEAAETAPETTAETEPEEETPTAITYIYDGDPLGRSGEATLYHYDSVAAASDGDAPVFFSGSTFYTEADAAEYIRSRMKLRAGTISLTYVSSTQVDDDTAKTLAKELLDLAFAHTGVPTEGDYLYWQWKHWDCSVACADDSVTVTFTYTFTYYTTAAQETQVDNAVANVLASLDLGDATDDQKVRKLYDYICENVTYDYTNLSDSEYTLKFTAYAAIINKTAVCQGYAVLFYRMLLEVSIDCRVIVGISSGGNHAWNIVQLDGEYYNADTTWDAGKSTYSFYLKCPANFSDHYRKSDYDTDSFHTSYPMSSTDREEADDNSTDSEESSVTHTLEHVEAKSATASQAGNIEYWVCTGCSQVFLDSEGTQRIAEKAVWILPITRLYNPASGEHLLATSQDEISSLTSAGWSVDGVLCYMRGESPVYRLYNQVSGEHLYTMNENEIENLLSGGDWTVDGVMAYSATEENGTPVYRLYNASAEAISSHLLSTSQEEMDSLTAQGDWVLEGVAFYAAK